jgi:hypothetical protein
MTATLEQLIDALAPNLADLRIRATMVEVEITAGDRRVRLCREIPEGEHDLVGTAIQVLEDARSVVQVFTPRAA